MIVVECGCARQKRGFRAIFENGKLDRTERVEPQKLSLRDKLRGVVEKPQPIQCAGLDLGAIRCAWCGERTFRCSCGIMSCMGVVNGDVYTCLCGERGTLGLMPDDAVVRGGSGSANKALPGPSRLLIGRS